jgi:hypothetical protein
MRRLPLAILTMLNSIIVATSVYSITSSLCQYKMNKQQSTLLLPKQGLLRLLNHSGLIVSRQLNLLAKLLVHSTLRCNGLVMKSAPIAHSRIHNFSLSLNSYKTHNSSWTHFTEINQLRDCIYKIECTRNRLDMELNFERRMAGMVAQSIGHIPRTHKHHPDLDHVRGKVRSTITYPEGGSHTMWITDGSGALDQDDEKENFDSSCPMDHPSSCSLPPQSTYKLYHKHHTPSSHSPAGTTNISSTAMASSTLLSSQPSIEV